MAPAFPRPPPVASTPRSARRRLRKELRETATLAAPIALSELASYGLHVVAGMYAGHLGRSQLGAAALATLFSNATGNALLAGVANSLDTLASQAVGARSWGLLGLHVHRCLTLALAACVPIGAAWWFGGRVLAATGGRLDPAVAALAGAYLRCLLLGLPAHAVWKVWKKELSALGHLAPALVGNALGLAVVAALAPALMWGTPLGFLGAPLATSAAQVAMAAFLTAYCLRWHAGMAAAGGRLLRLLRVPAGRAAVAAGAAAAPTSVTAATSAPSPWAAAATTATSRRPGGRGGRVRLRTDSEVSAADGRGAADTGIQMLPSAVVPAVAAAPSPQLDVGGQPRSPAGDAYDDGGEDSELITDAAAGTPHSTRSAPPELDVGSGGAGSKAAVTVAVVPPADSPAAAAEVASASGGGRPHVGSHGLRIQAPQPQPPPPPPPPPPPHVRASSGWVRPARAADAAGGGTSIHDILDAAARPDGLTLRVLLSPAAAGVMARLALPSAALLLAEWGTQQALAVMAGQPAGGGGGGEPPGRTGERLAAHSVATHTVTLLYVPAMSLGIAAAVRVGAAVGDAHVPDARLAARAAAYAVAGYAAACGVLLLALARTWPRLWTTDAAVVDAAADVMPLLAGVVAFDAAQAVAGGVLRGLSRPGVAAAISVASYGAVGLPCAYAVGIAAGRGVPGLWAGFCIALVLATAASTFVLGAWTDWDAEAVRAQALARLTRPLAASVDADAALLRQLEELQHADGGVASGGDGRPMAASDHRRPQVVV